MTASLSSGPSHSRGAQRGLHAVAPSPAPAVAAPVLRLVPQPEGLLQVHTAPFRGSVPTVLSQALRAAGLGSRVLISQFLKGGVDQGIHRPITLCGRLQWLRPAMVDCVDGPGHSPEAIVELWAHCRDQLLAGAVDLLVLDELGLALAYGYLDLDAVLATLEQRPAQMDVILTGPSIPEPLMAMADQVTQLRRGF
ncbi:MAG: ATP--corrinoid adenosyltransferase [Synechococcaceae bacterium WB9_2_112]|nr:ATP--corrinoid adenosyltransferase [Synechococcaceae bacterium WB9_2_112]